MPIIIRAQGAPVRILITGATGFVGTHLRRCFLAHTDWDITGTSYPDTPPAPEDARRETLRFLDLRDAGATRALLAEHRDLADKPDRLSRLVLPLLKDLLAQESSDFDNLYDWGQDYIQERPLPPRFYEQSEGCQR